MQMLLTYWLSNEVTPLVSWPSVGVSPLAALSKWPGANSFLCIIWGCLQRLLQTLALITRFIYFSNPYGDFFFQKKKKKHLAINLVTFGKTLVTFWRRELPILPKEYKPLPPKSLCFPITEKLTLLVIANANSLDNSAHASSLRFNRCDGVTLWLTLPHWSTLMLLSNGDM